MGNGSYICRSNAKERGGGKEKEGTPAAILSAFSSFFVRNQQPTIEISIHPSRKDRIDSIQRGFNDKARQTRRLFPFYLVQSLRCQTTTTRGRYP